MGALMRGLGMKFRLEMSDEAGKLLYKLAEREGGDKAAVLQKALALLDGDSKPLRDPDGCPHDQLSNAGHTFAGYLVRCKACGFEMELVKKVAGL